METLRTQFVEWGVASRALTGQRESGDHYLVKTASGLTLIAAVDGLGHGEEAAAAAHRAIRCLDSADLESETPITLVRRCHEELRGTRGVVMSLATFRALDSTMTWVGVGNVEGILLHKDAYGLGERDTLVVKGGVVGDRLPLLTGSILQLIPGDLLLLATDGILPGFADYVNLHDSAQAIADSILARYRRGTDDALVLAVRYLHGQSTTASG